jgi:hypothetical protein
VGKVLETPKLIGKQYLIEVSEIKENGMDLLLTKVGPPELASIPAKLLSG